MRYRWQDPCETTPRTSIKASPVRTRFIPVIACVKAASDFRTAPSTQAASPRTHRSSSKRCEWHATHSYVASLKQGIRKGSSVDTRQIIPVQMTCVGTSQKCVPTWGGEGGFLRDTHVRKYWDNDPPLVTARACPRGIVVTFWLKIRCFACGEPFCPLYFRSCLQMTPLLSYKRCLF